jgi:hypothetical protein
MLCSIIVCLITFRSWDSPISIAHGYGLDDQSSICSRCWEYFSFVTMSRLALGSTQPPIQQVPRFLSPWVKQLGCEADHSPPSSAEVKNVWRYTSTPLYVCMAWCLVKHTDTFYLYLIMFHTTLRCTSWTKCLLLYTRAIIHLICFIYRILINWKLPLNKFWRAQLCFFLS